MSKLYRCRPSEILYIHEEYVAYCFDEACALFISYLNNKKTPHFQSDIKENNTLKKLMSGQL